MPLLRTLLATALLGALASSDPTLALWTHTTRLARTPLPEDRPRVAVAGCMVHVAWIDHLHDELHYTRSMDGGETWSTPRLVGASPGSPIRALEIAASGPQVHLVWEQGPSHRPGIHYRRSTNGGTSWRPARRLSPVARTAQEPTLAAEEDNVYVAWIRTRRGNSTKPAKLIFLHSANRGKDWSPPRRVDRRAKGLSTPRITSDGGRLHLVWGRRENRGGTSLILEILHRSSADGGSTWDERNQPVKRLGFLPWSVAANGDTVHLLWGRFGYKESRVEYKRSTDMGQTWSPAITLDDEGTSAALSASGTSLDTVWIHDLRGTGPVVHSRSGNGGITWSPKKRLFVSGRQPTLATADEDQACGGATHVLFARHLVKNGNSFQEIYHRRHPRYLGQ